MKCRQVKDKGKPIPRAQAIFKELRVFKREMTKVLQQQKVITVMKPPQVMPVLAEGEVSVMGILKTVTWREALEVLLGIIMILCFMIALVFWA